MSKQVLLSYAGLAASLALSTSQTVTFMFTVCGRRRVSSGDLHLRRAHKLVINIHEPGELIQRWQRTGWSFVYLSASKRPPCTGTTIGNLFGSPIVDDGRSELQALFPWHDLRGRHRWSTGRCRLCRHSRTKMRMLSTLLRHGLAGGRALGSHAYTSFSVPECFS